jgi:hypothetical protein
MLPRRRKVAGTEKMETDELLKSIFSTRCWYKGIGISRARAYNYKTSFNTGQLGIESKFTLLEKLGYKKTCFGKRLNKPPRGIASLNICITEKTNENHLLFSYIHYVLQREKKNDGFPSQLPLAMKQKSPISQC